VQPAPTLDPKPKPDHHARAGRMGARSRWGPGPRWIRLDGLPPDVAQALFDIAESVRAAHVAATTADDKAVTR
jgi:hypothetical protein